ncbi:MAG: iron complex transport system ATP-binding protein, partial [Verrucomicrobiales bacterium]
PQTPTIPIGMAVLDYVLLGRTPHLHSLASPSQADVQLAHDVIHDLDLADLVTRSVETLSGGERQRVVIGRALAQEAPIILLDEPTTALDLGHQQDVLRLLDRLRRTHRRTIISTMHDLTMAGQHADRLILLAGGSIVAEGSPIEVLTAANIATHYRASVDVTHRDGAVLVVPHIDRPDSYPT